MIIVTYLMSLVLSFAIVLLDIVAVFLAVRWLVRRWPARWLSAFNTAGAQIVDGLLEFADRMLAQRGGRTARPGVVFAASLLGVALLRTILWGLLRITHGETGP